jgi:hypothetical protein
MVGGRGGGGGGGTTEGSGTTFKAFMSVAWVAGSDRTSSDDPKLDQCMLMDRHTILRETSFDGCR